MKRFLFFLNFVIVTGAASGQNFQAIHDNGYRLFDSDHGLRTIGVDSTAFMDGDSVFYLSKTIQKLTDDYSCYTPDGPSWMGAHIRISPDGTHLFYNLDGDTIRFLTQAGIGEVWPVYDYNDLYIQGEVISVEEEIMFDGISDLVKTISLQAMNAEMNPISHLVNDKIVRFSENYGIVGPLNFVVFPLDIENYLDIGLVSYSLAGLEGMDVGVQNLTIKEIFDFNPGDELHVRTWAVSMGMGIERHTVIKYLTRSESGDSIIYSRQIEIDNYNVVLGDLEYVGFSTGIEEEIITSNPVFDQWSMLPFEDDVYDGINYNTQYSHNFPTKIFGLDATVILPVSENECWMEMIDGGCMVAGGEHTYTTQRGGPYYDCENWNFSYSVRELVYSLIDSVETGERFSLLLNNDEIATPEFQIYPNPAQDRIFVQFSEIPSQVRIEMMDLQGRLLKSENLTNTRSEVRIENLPQGIFIYRILSGNEILKTGKIVVQR